MRYIRPYLTLSALVVASPLAVAHADTITVCSDGSADHSTIQDAIDAADHGDVVLVCRGTYNEKIDFKGKAITLRSTVGPKITIIDATDLDDTVVTCVSGEGKDTVLDGFTITGGNPIAPFPNNLGGGMFNEGSSPTVTRCIFLENTAGNGGGMYNLNSSPAVVDCKFVANSATGVGVPGGFGGSGMVVNNSNPVVINCIFVKNDMTNNGGGMYIWGDSIATVVNCTFFHNWVGDRGGGIMIAPNGGSPQAIITNSVFWANGDHLSAESGQIHVADGGTAAVSYSCIQGCATFCADPVNHNIGGDPRFVDGDGPDDTPGTEDDDLHLSPGSPCIDAGTNDAVPVEFTADLDGYLRFVDGDDDGSKEVDMGAYEWAPDSDGDGIPNLYDVCPCTPAWVEHVDEHGCPIGDLDDDCDVDLNDFATFAGSFGAVDCP